MKGSTDATMTMTASGKAMPGLTGPFSIKGTNTMDLNPA
jgi:hypothetical protein